MKLGKEKWVETVLASAEGIQRARASAHFYDNTISRIKEEATVSSDYVLRIAAGLMLVVALNVFACISFSKSKDSNQNACLMAFAKEYSINGSSDNF